MSNFRGISLISIAAKVFNRVIRNRMHDEVPPPSYVHSKQDLEEEKVALCKHTSSDAYLNNTIRRTFL